MTDKKDPIDFSVGSNPQATVSESSFGLENGNILTNNYRLVRVDKLSTEIPTTATNKIECLYVVDGMTAQPRLISPKLIQNGPSGTTIIQPPRKRDEKKRATHNEVERRRRDKINNWITKLGSIIPDTCEASKKHGGTVDGLSKGGILAKACEYISDLKQTNETAKVKLDAVSKENKRLLEMNDRLEEENINLREVLLRHGIEVFEFQETKQGILNNTNAITES